MDQLELVKENARPVKGGRDAAQLARALSDAADPGAAAAAAREQERTRAAFEARVGALSGAHADPLREWREYVAWLQQAYASGARADLLVDALERATRFIKSDAALLARYRNDPEYVKLWVAYVSWGA